MTPADAPHPGRELFYCLWFGAVVSLGEIGYWTFAKEITHHRVIGFEYLWQIPLAYAITFGVLGAAWTLASRWRATAFRLRALIFACTSLSVTAWLFLYAPLHRLAALVLALGLSAQVFRLAERHPAVVPRLARRTFPALVCLLMGLALAAVAWPALAERRAIARLPPPVVGPNVLLIVLDTVRADALSLYGYPRGTTPRLAEFAARGVVFDRAFSTSPWTLPSHGAMFTGRLPWELSGDFLTPIDGTHPTLAEALAGRGYLTAGFVANTDYGGAEFGLARGFARYEDHRSSAATVIMRASLWHRVVDFLGLPGRFGTHDNFGRKSAEEVNRTFLRWLSTRDKGRPYFAFLNYYDAHSPYSPPDRFARLFSSRPARGDLESKPLDQWRADEIQTLRDAYDGALAYLDHHLGELFATLDRLAELENTLVIVTSDHGEHFGEHGLLGHSHSLYPQLLHVPLVVVWPGRVTQGQRAGAFVSLLDLPATIVELTGVAPRPVFPGVPLSRHWQSHPVAGGGGDDPVIAQAHKTVGDFPAWYPAAKGTLHTVIDGGKQYIRSDGDGREELYDLVRDPSASEDLGVTDVSLMAPYRALLPPAP